MAQTRPATVIDLRRHGVVPSWIKDRLDALNSQARRLVAAGVQKGDREWSALEEKAEGLVRIAEPYLARQPAQHASQTALAVTSDDAPTPKVVAPPPKVLDDVVVQFIDEPPEGADDEADRIMSRLDGMLDRSSSPASGGGPALVASPPPPSLMARAIILALGAGLIAWIWRTS